ncbi:transmembrane protein, putative [Bodo saltans]|uniref:Transmembrane protein, putative n=1 Tax=Bodo saltans TaxID=75058 RepID=A0A0S4IVU2_BODSA|nr:transmembrane protein, putative [Bodo saltans]|eukprot:CUG03864.1 transmembrane protein, putative [Bodo saltans]
MFNTQHDCQCNVASDFSRGFIEFFFPYNHGGRDEMVKLSSGQEVHQSTSGYTTIHIGRSVGTSRKITSIDKAPRTSFVIVGLFFMFFLAVLVSWHSIQRVYSTLATEVDDEEGEIELEVVDDGIKPPPLMTTAPTNPPQAGALARNTTRHGSASSTKLLSSDKQKPASSEKRAPKHYSHGMLQRVVEGVMKNVHRRNHHSQNQR